MSFGLMDISWYERERDSGPWTGVFGSHTNIPLDDGYPSLPPKIFLTKIHAHTDACSERSLSRFGRAGHTQIQSLWQGLSKRSLHCQMSQNCSCNTVLTVVALGGGLDNC